MNFFAYECMFSRMKKFISLPSYLIPATHVFGTPQNTMLIRDLPDINRFATTYFRDRNLINTFLVYLQTWNELVRGKKYSQR